MTFKIIQNNGGINRVSCVKPFERQYIRPIPERNVNIFSEINGNLYMQMQTQ